ncbi:MAG: DNA polymerase III subunit [Chloroflexota bacterium]|nr:DNA polymerase III subunit [Chloroflexota bacterium]
MRIDTNWGILGHEWAVDLLRGQLSNGRSRHAYLITGPRGVGRRTLALRMAQALNCPQPTELGIPCRQCRTCEHIERMQHPDLSVVQSEEIGKSLKVEQVRELQLGLSLAPYEATYRVALLLRFEEATLSAANALLKTLEEPPPQVVLLVTAQDAESLLPTIVSRCEIIRLRPLPIDQLSQGLETYWGIPAERAKLLAHISGGRPGQALRLHQDDDAMEQRQTWLDDHQRLLSASRVERFHYAEELAKNKSDLQSALRTWLSLWRDVMLRVNGASAPLVNLDREDEIDAMVATLSPAAAREMVSHLERTRARLNRNTNTRLTAEVLMLNLP